MSVTHSGGEPRGIGVGRPGRPADAPFLAVSIASLLAVALAATAPWQPEGEPAPAREPVVTVVPAPVLPASAPSPGPVYAVQRPGLAGVDVVDGELAWNGVRAGMERPAVEARLGALPPAVPHPAGWCGEHESRVETEDSELILAFDGPGERARLVSITVVVPEAAATADGRAEPAAVFQTAAGGRIAVEPGVGVTFGDVCLG